MRRIGGEVVTKADLLRAHFLADGNYITAGFEEYYIHVRDTAKRIAEIMTFSDIGRFNDTLPRTTWRTKLELEKSLYDELIRASGMESHESMMPRLNSLRQSWEILSREIEADSAEIAKYDGVQSQISTKLGELVIMTEKLKELRIVNIRELNKSIPKVVYMDYSEQNYDFREWLDEKLKSKGLQDKAGTIGKLMRLSPQQLTLIAINNDVNSIKSIGLNESSANVVISAVDAQATQNLHRINMVFSPDIGLIKGDIKFTAATLSIGEKVSAVFPLLTISTGRPIILDQPEDDLDHSYIIDNITATIKNNKFQQQFIIVTHNPNIPVLADSDQIIKMKRVENQQKCTVESRGAIEDDNIRSHVVKLDGGISAIELRYKKYRA